MTHADWPVRPMEPVSSESVIDEDDTLYQVKWDGVRVLAYIEESGVRLFNRNLRERTRQYPELVEQLSALDGDTVLDGEIIALNEYGKPDFPRVLERDLARAVQPGSQFIASRPVYYMVFDVLWYRGENLCDRPLTERLGVLDSLGFDEGSLIHRVESVPGAGTALFAAVKSEELEGIVSKKKDSPYRIGKKSELWRKVKCFRHITALVGGYRTQDDRIRSLLLGIPREEGLLCVGAASTGISGRQWESLRVLLPKINAPCPFVNPPMMDGVRWVQPVLPVRVRFLEYTSRGNMRAPVITGFPEGIP
ncbi:MAG: hypothetical protein ACOX7W_00355 [Christensenellales bacterium]|jgi:bifunctional non-homologous end joining protein LigD